MDQRIRPHQIDVHEILKRDALATPRQKYVESNRPCASSVYGVSDHYIILDSFLKLRDSNINNGEFKWNFMVQGVTDKDVIGVKDKMETVIEIQIGIFNMPILSEVTYTLAPAAPEKILLQQNNINLATPFSPTLVPNVVFGMPPGQYPQALLVSSATPSVLIPWIGNPYSQVPFADSFTIQIREAGLQSYSDKNGARHHFEYTLSSLCNDGRNPNMLIAQPLNGTQWDTYTFTEPLKDVHGMTLIFRNPDIPIRFQPDCFYDVLIESDASAAPGPFLRINVPNHGLNMGDRIYITGFNSGNLILDSYVNRLDGQVAAGNPSVAPLNPGVPITGNFIWTDPAIGIANFIAIPIPVLPQTVTVFVAKRRMRIPMRIRGIVAHLTNYISP